MNRNLSTRLTKLEGHKTDKPTQRVIFANSSAEAEEQIAELKRSGVANEADEFVSFIMIYEEPPTRPIAFRGALQ